MGSTSKSPKKEKKYTHDFEQDLNHEVPKIRNISEQNTWTKPGWTETITTKKGHEDDVDGTRTNIEPPKQKHTWEKPNWAVVDRKNTAATATDTARATATAGDGEEGNSNAEIVKDAVIQPNQHPILKTSQLQLSRIEQQKRRELEEQIKALEAELASAAVVTKDTKNLGGGVSTQPVVSSAAVTTSNSRWGKKNNNNNNNTSTSTGVTDTNVEVVDDRGSYTADEKLEELRRIAKEKEDAAWRAREQERRIHAKEAQEKARAEARMFAKENR